MRAGAARTTTLGYDRDLPKHIQQQVEFDPRQARRLSIHEKMTEAMKLRAGVLFSTGKMHDITLQDLEELFIVLSVDGGGAVYFRIVDEFLEKCLSCTQVELNSMHQHIERKLGGVIYASQLYRALQVNSIRSLLQQAHRHKLQQLEAHSHTEELHLERPFFVERVRWRVNRDDAFGTLPFTGVYLIVFMVLVVYHLQIWRRQQLERGIESWIDSSSEKLYGPFIQEHVYSYTSFDAWLLQSGLDAIFGQTTGSAGSYELQLATSNVLVGDVQLQQFYGDGYESKSIWLLNTDVARNYLAGSQSNPSRFKEAAAESVKTYFNNGWIDDDTKQISVYFYTYSNQAEMYTRNQIWLRLDRLGFVRPVVKSRAIVIFSYLGSSWLFIVDGFYILMILHTLVTECKDMFAACALGFRSYLNYCSFWNTVDWTTIGLGGLNVGLWIVCCLAMQGDILHSTLTESDDIWIMKSNMVPWTVDQSESLHDKLTQLLDLSFALQGSVALTAVFIVLKFFKGFEANPRLQTVTMTLKMVATDVFHFSVVLLPIYLAFAVIGHILFGQDVLKFYTLANSLNTGITVLMGEFDWYADLSDTPAIMPSGMPRFVLTIWFVVYMGFVLLVMLNMLLAIVLEKYSEVYAILSQRSDARTLFQQTQRFIRRRIDTRNFIPLYKLSRMLEDTVHPAHPQEMVTQQSLKDAFPSMSDEQIDYILNFLKTELHEMMEHKKKTENAFQDRSSRVERMVQSIAEEIHVVGACVQDASQRLQSIETSIRQDPSILTEHLCW